MSERKVEPVEVLDPQFRRRQPRQLLRIAKTDAGNGLVKVELRYVSYQRAENVQNAAGQEEVTAALLAELFNKYQNMQSADKATFLSRENKQVRQLLQNMEDTHRRIKE